MKLTVAYRPSFRGAESSLIWANAPQGRDIRIRLKVATEAGENVLNSAGFHFCLMYT